MSRSSNSPVRQALRILHVVPSLNPELGGPTRVVLDLVRSLRKLDVDAEIVTTNDCGAKVFDVPLGQRTEFEGVPVRFFARSVLRRREFIVSEQLFRWLAENTKGYSALDIHYLFTFSSTAAARIARREGVPYVLRTMGQLAPWSLRQSRIQKALYGLAFERANLSGAAVVHCTSEAEAYDVGRYAGRVPTVTIPLGVTPHLRSETDRAELEARYGIRAGTKVILFLSRLHMKKQPEVLLEAAAQLRERGADFRVLFAGAGTKDYEEALRSRVSELQLDDRVTFTGFVNGRIKSMLLSGADVFCLPSRSENFGIAVAEALSAGVPVVVSPGVDIAPLIEAADAGLVVGDKPLPVADALWELMTDPVRAAKLGRNGRVLADSSFCWGSIGARWKQIYSDITPIPTASRRLEGAS